MFQWTLELEASGGRDGIEPISGEHLTQQG